MMQSFLRVASARPDAAARNDTVRTWVKQVRDLAYDVEDCLLDFALYSATVSSSTWSWLPAPLAERRRIAARIRDLKASVEELNQRNLRYHVIVDHCPPMRGVEVDVGQQQLLPDQDVLSAAEVAFQEWDIIGRSSEKAELKDKILGGDGGKLGVVSVWGMGGMGKSSLVSIVRNDPVLLDAFDCGAWVTVPHPLDNADDFRRCLRKQLQLGAAAHDEPADAIRVREHLKDKRYVIVVDDLLSQEEWTHVWQVLNFHNGKGSRVIVTTRRQDVARHCARNVGEGYGLVYELKPLGDNESMSLLCKKVYNTSNFNLPVEMEEQASRILKRCRGLPLAISTIGGLLANRPKTSIEWMKMHEHLGAELESDLRNITNVIVSSYDGLPYHLKSIFIYLSIFPENQEIRCTRLLRRWMAEGYIAKNRDMPVEEVGERFYNELINRSMIQPSKKKIIPGVRVSHCMIHSMVRQIILSKAVEENQLFLVEKQCNEVPHSKIRHLVVSRWKGREEKLEHINLSYIRSLTIFGECPVSLISPKMRLLRVLDLEDTINMRNEDLRHIGELPHLSYLSLRGTKISKLPSSLQKLRYLETLDIEDTKVTKLPHGIFKLEKLRYLLAGVNFSKDLLQKLVQPEMNNKNTNLLGNMAPFLCCNRMDYCNISNMDQLSVRAPKGIEKLRNLHMFGAFNVGQGNGVGGRLGKLTNLQRLGVTVTGLTEEEGRELCQSIEKLGRLQRLEVRSYSLEFLAKMDESSTPKHLASLKLLGNLFILPKWITSLNDLATVKMLGTKLQQGQVDILGNLRSLAALCLWERSYRGESLCFSAGKFPKLKFLDIDWLDNIETMEIKDGAMPELERLWLNNCKALCDSGEGLSGVPYLPNLNELLVKKCGEKEKLMEILQWQVSEHRRRPKFLIGKSILPTSSKPSTSASAVQ
ncbi:disease resistance protein PIK6-NP-like [Triticum dicoccoides]|nr:disease resistance protein PIK6-NP-like [Triticum dicoccoides]